MRIAEIRDVGGLRAIEAQWRALLRESASDSLFLTPEWLFAWWSSYGQDGGLRVLAAYDDTGALRGLAPFREQYVHRTGHSAPALLFLGDGSNDSEYLDCIVARGCEQQAVDAMYAHLREQINDGLVFLLNEIPAGSPNLPALEAMAVRNGLLQTEAETACGTVLLPETWDGYLTMLKPRFRTKVRSVLRNLEARGDVEFGFCNSEDELRELLPVLFDLHTKRWNADGKPGVFGWSAKRDFYHALSPALLAQGWLRFSWMRWRGRVLACQYGFLYNGGYLHLQEGYEPASEHWNAGISLRAWTIREFIRQGVREYDFLGGIGRHKTDWGAQPKLSKHLQLARRNARNLVFCRGGEWKAKARESVAEMLPESALEARRNWLARRASAGAGDSGALRSAIANCYFHLGLPAVVRPLRERYQLTSGTSLRKRHEPAARILYYHRVNDDADPFFPATATRQFEEQMQFVSRYYQVVSLRELLRRLEESSPDTLLAITFDDGYRDNHDIALPILEKYGLPATIFLTTGAIDSEQPIWFEQLAGAAKRTGREYIDLEIDIPRRFWFRTEAERLASNDGIFRVLRVLSDSERRDQLAAILKALDTPSLRERSPMLSWDQIRSMKTRGIDFGGHTVTHPFFSKLTAEGAAWEAGECKRRIEQELQDEVEHFAYPNGREEDIGGWNKDVLREAGYRAAVTTIWGMNYRSTDRMELRRGAPWENSLAMFASKLDWYQLRNG